MGRLLNLGVMPASTMDTSTFDTRAALRAQMRERRIKLSAAERIAAANGVAASLEQLPEFLVDRRVAGYWAVGGELPLHAAVARLNARGQQYCLPIVGRDRGLRFAPLAKNAELQPNRHGIPEPRHAESDLLTPQEIDLVLVPLTAFDRSGRRLGMGGGYYDRSFAVLHGALRPAQPLLVGIGYSFQEVEALAASEWDVALDFIATEKELIDCTPPETRP
jgi:5-formyltetrahydrofolate cyclo-ligase